MAGKLIADYQMPTIRRGEDVALPLFSHGSFEI
jgi:hypothetical protein